VCVCVCLCVCACVCACVCVCVCVCLGVLIIRGFRGRQSESYLNVMISHVAHE